MNKERLEKHKEELAQIVSDAMIDLHLYGFSAIKQENDGRITLLHPEKLLEAVKSGELDFFPRKEK